MKLSAEIVVGKSNTALSHAASLREKKYRRRFGTFLADGCKLLTEICASGAEILTVWLDADRAKSLYPFLRESERQTGRELSVRLVSPALFPRLTEEGGSEGIVTEAAFPPQWRTAVHSDPGENERCLMLCGLQDPGNLGAVARSALAFGVTRLLLTADCVDPASGKALRASMGALLRLNIDMVTDPVGTLRALRAAGRRVYAAELRPGAVPLLSCALCAQDVFLIGNEGHGISPALSAEADASVYIPISTKAESLNAAAAATVLLWQQSLSKN